ncbi:MAG: phage holin family protein [Nostocaceae cyanobacterium]|nr:phage holin family protein [Nostocaceae cyanobacterium]
MNIGALLVAWLVTAASFFIISKLPIGVEIDTPGKTLISAAVLGIVTAIVKPILSAVLFLPNVLTLRLFSGVLTFFIAVICFGIAAYLVQGFRLRFGVWSAIIGALALSLVSSLIYSVLPV